MKKLIPIVLLLFSFQNIQVLKNKKVIKKEKQNLIINNQTYKRNLIKLKNKKEYICNDSIYDLIKLNLLYEVTIVNYNNKPPYDYEEIIKIK
jgi:hypothetical protein